MSTQPQPSGQTTGRLSTALRILLSLLFLPIYAVVMVALGVLTALGLLSALVMGKRPPIALIRLADRVVCYNGQIANYLIWVDLAAPFPFNPLPPASELFTEHAQAAATDYVGADDATITHLSGDIAEGNYADAEDETFVSAAAEAVAANNGEMDLDLGDDQIADSSADETTQLNPGKDPQELLDDTVLQLPENDEMVEEAAIDQGEGSVEIADADADSSQESSADEDEDEQVTLVNNKQ